MAWEPFRGKQVQANPTSGAMMVPRADRKGSPPPQLAEEACHPPLLSDLMGQREGGRKP